MMMLHAESNTRSLFLRRKRNQGGYDPDIAIELQGSPEPANIRKKSRFDMDYHIVTPEERLSTLAAEPFEDELSDACTISSHDFSCEEDFTEEDLQRADSCYDEILAIVPMNLNEDGRGGPPLNNTSSPRFGGRKVTMTDFFRSKVVLSPRKWSQDCFDLEETRLPSFAGRRQSASEAIELEGAMEVEGGGGGGGGGERPLIHQCFGCLRSVAFAEAPCSVSQMSQLSNDRTASYLIPCNYCGKNFCSGRCSRTCEGCCEAFCVYCVQVRYVGQFEQRLCPDCSGRL